MAVSPTCPSAALHETGHILGFKLGSGFGLYRRRLGVMVSRSHDPEAFTHTPPLSRIATKPAATPAEVGGVIVR